MPDDIVRPTSRILRTVKPTINLHLDSYVVVDLETTGLRIATDDIIEIGSVRIEKEEVVGQFQQLVCLENMPIVPSFVSSLTGITTSILDQYGYPLETVLGAWLKFAGDLPLVAHNSACDYNFLCKAIVKCNERRLVRNEAPWNHINYLIFDTLTMARKLYPGWKHNLGALASRLNIDCKGAHRALQDSIMTHELLQTMKRHPAWPKWYGQRVGWVKKMLKRYQAESGIEVECSW